MATPTYELINVTTLTTATGSVFLNPPSTFRHLIVVFNFNRSVNNAGLLMRFNGSSSGYDFVKGSATPNEGVSRFPAFNGSAFDIYFSVGGVQTGRFVSKLLFNNINSQNRFKGYSFHCGLNEVTTGYGTGLHTQSLSQGITQINFIIFNQTFPVGSVFKTYGILS